MHFFRIQFFMLWALLFNYSSLQAIVDLECRKQDFVLETTKIDIAGYPHAFNPSIVNWKGSLLMSFRIIPSSFSPPLLNCGSGGDSQIGLVWLDEHFCPNGPPQILNLNTSLSRSEDARLIVIDERLYMVYSDNRDPFISDGGFRMYVAELELSHGQFSIYSDDALLRFAGESPKRREKNWVPFDYAGNLLLAYSLVPHRIFYPLLGSGYCEELSRTKSNIKWNWGEPRGGTPALLNGDEYLSFFHSSKDMSSLHSKGKIMPHYFMGAYTFSAHPPFTITHMSSEPIIGEHFYEGPAYEPYWKPVQVVFPCGFIMDDSYIWISYGRQDHEIWIVKLDKAQLLQSLKPVK